jgi:hypothetical protein
MANAQTIDWQGLSGMKYTYWIHPIGTSFKEEPGNYIFAKETRPGYWSPVYAGQTQNLSARHANHEKETCATRNGATHIHAHTNSGGENARLTEEADLIRRWKPPCNDQLT